VALNVQARQLVGVGQLFMQLRIIFQYRQVDVSHQLQQRPVLRNFLLVHGRHGLRKLLPNLISRDGVRHDVLPPVNTSWSVGKLPPGGGRIYKL
jgi:hypothetical protein